MTILSAEFLWAWLFVAAACVNIVTFDAYRCDKEAAVAGTWRISEQTLLTLALIGGTPAAYVACRRFRHKTAKKSFGDALFGIALLQVVALGTGTILLI